MVFLKTIIASVMVVTILLASFPTTAASGVAARAEEHEIKAAFIYNFSKFVTWPSNAFKSDTDPLRVCVMDDGEITEAIETLANKSSKGRQIKVIRSKKVSDANGCHLIFIGESTDETLTKKILSSAGKNPILTVGDSPAFVRYGGIIGLTTSGNKLAFEINPAIAKRNGLAISSKMLSLAKIVREQP